MLRTRLPSNDLENESDASSNRLSYRHSSVSSSVVGSLYNANLRHRMSPFGNLQRPSPTTLHSRLGQVSLNRVQGTSRVSRSQDVTPLSLALPRVPAFQNQSAISYNAALQNSNERPCDRQSAAAVHPSPFASVQPPLPRTGSQTPDSLAIYDVPDDDVEDTLSRADHTNSARRKRKNSRILPDDEEDEVSDHSPNHMRRNSQNTPTPARILVNPRRPRRSAQRVVSDDDEEEDEPMSDEFDDTVRSPRKTTSPSRTNPDEDMESVESGEEYETEVEDQEAPLPNVEVDLNQEETSIVVRSEQFARTFKLSISKLQNAAKDFEYLPLDDICDSIKYVVRNTRPSALKIGHDWLLTTTLPELDERDDESAIRTASRLIDLYHVAHIFDSRNLENNIMDRLKSRDTCANGYPSRTFVRKIYEYTKSWSKLRRFAVDTFVYKADRWLEAEVDEWFKLHRDYGNKQFVEDVKKAQAKLRRGGKNPEDPNRTGKCHYHHHFEGQPCK